MNNPKKVFSQIYDTHVDKIYRFIFFKVSSQEIAQDLCSETFLKAWQYFKDDKKKVDNPQAFLYQIARNLVIDHYREKGRTQTVPADFVPIIDPEQDLERKSLQDSDLTDIQAVLAEIKPEYQEVIVYHYINDLTVPEIAKMLKKSQGAVRVMLHRALKTVKNKIEKA